MDNRSKASVVNAGRKAKKDFDDICKAFRGMTWDEHERLLLGKKEDDHVTESEGSGGLHRLRGNVPESLDEKR